MERKETNQSRKHWSHDRRREYLPAYEELDDKKVQYIQNKVRRINFYLQKNGCKVTQYIDGQPIVSQRFNRVTAIHVS